MALGSGLRSQEEESTKNITCYRIGYKIYRLHGRLVHDEDSCHYSMQLLPTHKNISDEFLSTRTVFAVLIVPCMYS